MTSRPGSAYDDACRRAIGALRDRTALALARAGLLGIDTDLRELFAEGGA